MYQEVYLKAGVDDEWDTSSADQWVGRVMALNGTLIMVLNKQLAYHASAWAEKHAAMTFTLKVFEETRQCARNTVNLG